MRFYFNKMNCNNSNVDNAKHLPKKQLLMTFTGLCISNSSSTDYECQMKPFFNDLQNSLGNWADQLKFFLEYL